MGRRNTLEGTNLAGGVRPMVNPKVVIIGGNKVVAAWTSSTHTEVKVMTGIINNAPPLEPYIWPAPTKETFLYINTNHTYCDGNCLKLLVLPHLIGLKLKGLRIQIQLPILVD
jgi:hypothetical protein